MKTLWEYYSENQGKVVDKWAFYLTRYDDLFHANRDGSISLLEIGIQNGGSLEIWSKYFRNAKNIVGVDINNKCADLIYSDPRISLFIGDANSDYCYQQIAQASSSFNIIIDDGSHTSEDIIKSFLKYFPLLSSDGIYVVEDLHCSYWESHQGGLYYPFSSVAFFKAIIDVINFEFWGTEMEASLRLRGFVDQYDLLLPRYFLETIYSIEFSNSLCIIRKANKDNARLGLRIISGCQSIVSDHTAIISRDSASSVPSQKHNVWSNLNAPPEQQYQQLKQSNLLLENEINLVKAELKHQEMLVHSMLNSYSWRLTSMFRKLHSIIKGWIS